MFAVPDAKRVKRSRLFHEDDDSHGSRASSRSASPGEPPSDNIEVSYGFEYDFVTPTLADVEAPRFPDEPLPVTDAEEPEYQFRLFAPGTSSRAQHQQPKPATADATVRLSATPEPVALADALSLDKAHFIRPNRPESHYFTAALPEATIQQLKGEFAAVAMSTTDVISRAESTCWPGTALPWRVIQVELLNKQSGSGVQRPLEQVDSTTSQRKSSAQQRARVRTRPSKKRRILVRRRLALRKELGNQAKATDEMEREKRTRRNREKKVQKKERERRKKNEADGRGHSIERGEGREQSSEVAAEPAVTGTLPSIDPVKVSTNPTESQLRKLGEPASSGASSAATDARSTPTQLSAAATKTPPLPPTRRAPTSRAPTAATASTATKTAKGVSMSRHPTRPRI
ncbi:hypothetical protein A1O7_09240 [Cladophialophora yegresii CBS 114405]|uniref:Uncharacterized protein n=1 Tax=Cladophialophora yegresii CBS 114405 TaxID=1182544 RepID=W9W5R6_9EURO|nr:uncharacterized protein A1O7_09240 [Cladophialophora yegresii CBS 114405]EXJ53904.1 hypothetical protein A1O7_09240 [Cladophialophora yegresii CBS 114405]